MIVEESKREIVSNVTNELAFGFEESAKMFEIFSSKIYTYKIAAIVREISFNARDSHIDAGKADVPFRVVLPNDYHPYFEIEDFGIGLDAQGVAEIYTRYGKSTKTGNNNTVGALGLGSKTPFAYTTSFTITARKDGVERIYNAYIGNAGFPTISLLKERNTSECNGVKIKVPVKKEDFTDFENECRFILSFFEVRPEVIAVDFDFDIPEETVQELYSEGTSSIRTSHVRSALYSNQKMFAVMGGVCYAFKVGDIASTLNDRKLEYLKKIILASDYHSAFFNFDMGELSFNASRESLSLEPDKPTYKNLCSKINDYIDKHIRGNEEKYEHFTSPFDALRYTEEKFGSLGDLFINTFSYKGKPLRHYVRRRFKVLDSFSYETYLKETPMRGSTKVKRDLRPMLTHMMNNPIFVFTRDGKLAGIKKFSRHLAINNRNRMVIALKTPMTNHKINRLKMILGNMESEWHELIDLKEEEKKNKPQVARAPRKPAAKKKDTEVRAKFITFGTKTSSYNAVPFQKIDLNDGIETYYIDKDEYTNYSTEEMTMKCTSFITADLERIVTVQNSVINFILRSLGYEKVRVLIKTKMNQKSIKENAVGYFPDFFNDIIHSRISDIELALIANSVLERDLKGGIIFENAELDFCRQCKSMIYEGSFFEEFYEELTSRSDIDAVLPKSTVGNFNSWNVYSLVDSLDQSSLQFKGRSIDSELLDIRNKISNEYPLLSIQSWSSDEQKQKMERYIRQVDFFNENQQQAGV